jgi:hypothetical protein
MRHIVVALLLIGTSAFGQRAGGASRGSGARGGYGHPYRGGAVVVPYPVYAGGGYYSGYVAPPVGYGYGYDPSYGAYPPGSGYYGDPGYANGYGAPSYADPSQQPPVVIINQNYRPDPVDPVIRDYSNTPLPPAPGMTKYENSSQPYANQPPPADAQPTIYLIAMKDHTIFPTVAYWVDGDTLNYITSEGVRNRASLALVDRAFSQQLNDERHVEFKLPPAK